jgi:hypothetical protein
MNPLGEMEPSYCQELDVMGMQPHSREYQEYQVIAERSRFKAAKDPKITRLERTKHEPKVDN